MLGSSEQGLPLIQDLLVLSKFSRIQGEAIGPLRDECHRALAGWFGISYTHKQLHILCSEKRQRNMFRNYVKISTNVCMGALVF